MALEVDGFDLGEGKERSQKTVLGKRLRSHRDRIINGYRIAMAGKRSGAQQWRLLPPKEYLLV